MVSVQDVRSFLNNIASQRVSDDAIEKQIEIANVRVQAEKSSLATSEQIEDATLVFAGYLTMIAYAAQYERSVGALPSEISRHIALLETMTEAMMQYIKRFSPSFTPLVAQPGTLIAQYKEGLLNGDDY